MIIDDNDPVRSRASHRISSSSRSSRLTTLRGWQIHLGYHFFVCPLRQTYDTRYDQLRILLVPSTLWRSYRIVIHPERQIFALINLQFDFGFNVTRRLHWWAFTLIPVNRKLFSSQLPFRSTLNCSTSLVILHRVLIAPATLYSEGVFLLSKLVWELPASRVEWQWSWRGRHALQLKAHKLPNYYFTSRTETLQSNCNFGTAKLSSPMIALPDFRRQ